MAIQTAIYALICACSTPFRVLQAHLSCGKQLLSGHPQVGQGKQRDHLPMILGQAAVTSLGVTELSLDYPKGVFDRGTYRCFQMLDALGDLSQLGIGDGFDLAALLGDVEMSARLGFTRLAAPR